MIRNQLSATEQPDPILNTQPAVWELIIQDVDSHRPEEVPGNIFGPSAPKMAAVREALIKDMSDRDAWGRSKYKVPLQPYNGRDALIDLYQEFLDATAYTMQYRLEHPKDPRFTDVYKSLLSMLDFIRGEIFNRDGK